MSFTWDEQSIQYFLDASSYTGFHCQLAGHIGPFLNTTDTLCDLGCGLGRVDIALTPAVHSITAVDIDQNVLSLLKQEADHAGIQNLTTICADSNRISQTYDIILMSFFSNDCIEHALSICKSRLVWIVNGDDSGNLYPVRHRRIKKTTTQDACKQLDKFGLPYCVKETTIEFGQPFRSFDNCIEFVKKHTPTACKAEILHFLREHLVRTVDDAYSYYLPNPKKIGIVVADNTGWIQ